MIAAEQMPIRRRELAAAFLLFLVVAVTGQIWMGAYDAEFIGYADEAAHYVNGLLVRDYVAGGIPENPVTFAKRFYLHYPKIAIGVWPPVFSVYLGGWMLVFGVSRVSAVIAMALVMALLLLTFYRIARRDFPVAWALTGAVALGVLPVSLRLGSSVMADPTLALLLLLTTVALSRALENHNSRDIMLVGLLTAIGLATKANAVALGLAIPLAILLARQFQVFCNPWWYGAGALAAVLGIPWQFLTFWVHGKSIELGFQVDSHLQLAYRYGVLIPRHVGYVIAVLALVGFTARVILPAFRRSVEPRWAAQAGLAVGAWVFHSMIEHSEDPRYLLGFIPSILLFALAGVDRIVRLVPERRVPAMATALVLAALGVVGVSRTYSMRPNYLVPKEPMGVTQLVKRVLADPSLQSSVVLVASDEFGEGAFVSEFAMREARPGHHVLRSTKMLLRTDWYRVETELLYSTPAELMSFFESLPVGLLAIDQRPQAFAPGLGELLSETLERYRDKWNLVAVDADSPFRLYELRGHREMPQGEIEVDMYYSLGDPLVKEVGE